MIMSDEMIADAVKKYWNETHPHDVVVFFEQKYEHEILWNEEWVIATPHSPSNANDVIFNTDFCEGQTEVRNIEIVDLNDVIEQTKKGNTANWIICCDGYYPFCSVCGEEPPGREMSRFCPNCGRRMVTPERRKAHG